MEIVLPSLPVTEIFPALDKALEKAGTAVLVAPPGAGKTTLVPLHLLSTFSSENGMIILLEPRRLAARAAARRMAALLHEKPGETVGYRMRLDKAFSDKTRILVVTEGVFTRMILDDPELTGVSAVLFDEFHERSLDADFGLALTLDVRQALRPDLKLVIMSATLDGARVSRLLSAPVIESEGRAFPVAVRYRPRGNDERLEAAVVSAVTDMLYDEAGSILVFLPGQGEIERVARLLEEKRLPPNVSVMVLYGALSGKEQDEAIRPPSIGVRKVVLATSIAETSLTIDGVRIVIDSGLARVPVFEPAIGLTRLETQVASRASVDQRAGRAGRTEPGICLRLWHEGQTAALAPFSIPEILSADLSSFVLDCTAFGVTDPVTLPFLDFPPKPALQEAIVLLKRLHALDHEGRLTKTGQAMRALNLPVRYAHMVVEAAKHGQAEAAAELAVLLSERGLGGLAVDLDVRLAAFHHDRSERAQKARHLAQRLSSQAGGKNQKNKVRAGSLLLSAWPDRIAKARGNYGQFLLANGRGAVLDESLSLAHTPFLVVAELSGTASKARILSAAEVDEETIRSVLKDDIKTDTEISFDPESGTLKAKSEEKIGAITFVSRLLPTPKGEEAAFAFLQAAHTYGLELLPWKGEAADLRRRLHFLRQALGEPWPDMTDEVLLSRLEEWLLPFLDDNLKTLNSAKLAKALMTLVPQHEQREINKIAPTHFVVPTGSHILIRYDEDVPVLSVRVQELFSLNEHPSIARGRIPLLVELLSPAYRPIQITRDLPGFWKGSWADVAKDMRGRYPKHVWPDNPANTQPTRRAKPRKD